MKKQYTLLAIIGLATMVTINLLYFVIRQIEFSNFDNVPSFIFTIIDVLYGISPLFILPFFINLYKNQK